MVLGRCRLVVGWLTIAPAAAQTVPVAPNLWRLIAQEDTDGDQKITVHDHTTPFVIREANGAPARTLTDFYQMSVLLQELKQHDDRRIRLAIEIFCYRARKYIGALLAGMGGADSVIFTGGIGENSPEIRARICESLGWAGLTIDADKNAQTMGKEACISTADSKLQAWVIPTDEELLIARDTVRCILGEPHPT